MWEVDKKKVAFGKISWVEMLTKPKYIKKAAQFTKLHRLIDQFHFTTFD